MFYNQELTPVLQFSTNLATPPRLLILVGVLSSPFFLGLGAAAQTTLSITDDDYGQATNDFSIAVGTTLTNTVTWTATGLEGRSGFLFLRFDTAPTVELFPSDVRSQIRWMNNCSRRIKLLSASR